MGRLNEVIKKLEVEYKRILAKYDPEYPFSRMLIRRIIQENDSTLLKERAELATGNGPRSKLNKKERPIRKAHPGLYDVFFINKHSKESLRLTKEKGIYYESALCYFNYITDYGTEIHTELGHYEIVKRVNRIFLPEESHFGI